MRSFIILSAALFAGCSGADVRFEHTSELPISARGVGFIGDGDTAQVGMYGTTCAVDVASSRIGADVDFPTESEFVSDGGWVLDEPAYAVIADHEVHIGYPHQGWDGQVETLDVDAVQVRLTDDGVVGLLADCGVFWGGQARGDVTEVRVSDCVGSSFAASTDGVAAVSTGSDVVLVSEDGAITSVGVAGDLVAWDRALDVLYIAERNGSVVTGVHVDGNTLWTTPVEGRIKDLEAMGTHGAAAVMTELDSGIGQLYVIDGQSGEVNEAIRTPSAARALHASFSGEVLSLELDQAVHFFEVKQRDNSL